MNFFEAPGLQKQLFPFSLIRPIEELRVGIITIKEKWQHILPSSFSQEIPANLVPSQQHLTQIKEGRSLSVTAEDDLINRPWDIFNLNGRAIEFDFSLLTEGRSSQPLSDSNKLIGAGKLFIEEGAVIEHSIINTTHGPVYIGKNAEIMEGCLLRGPLAVCEGAVLKMGSKVYGATTIGPYCVAGGEIKNSVFLGYSNKGHDGYIGDSVIGEWCNLGAGTSNSNLKNNAGEVNVFDVSTGTNISAGTKCGLMLGDYSRAAINTSFNTGTITGICCNIFGAGLTPKFIPSFSWGADGVARYAFDKALRDIGNWKKLKKHSLSDGEISRLRHTFDNY